MTELHDKTAYYRCGNRRNTWVSRTTVNTRITKGLSADDLITVCRSLCVNPVDALTELGYLAYDEVMLFQDSDGKLVDTATERALFGTRTEAKPCDPSAGDKRNRVGSTPSNNVAQAPQCGWECYTYAPY